MSKAVWLYTDITGHDNSLGEYQIKQHCDGDISDGETSEDEIIAWEQQT